jgi:hypothetical protein
VQHKRGLVKMSKLYLVDLAGSEKVRTYATATVAAMVVLERTTAHTTS